MVVAGKLSLQSLGVYSHYNVAILGPHENVTPEMAVMLTKMTGSRSIQYTMRRYDERQRIRFRSCQKSHVVASAPIVNA